MISQSRRLQTLVLTIFLFASCSWIANQTVSAQGSKLAHLYPHWDLSQKEIAEKVSRIEAFVQTKSEKTRIAVFDWDGTLVDEHIVSQQLVQSGMNLEKARRSLQSVWHTWAALYMDSLSVPLFPMFRTRSIEGGLNLDLVDRDEYLEGKTNVEVDGYNKFTQIAVLEAGMSPADMDLAVRQFLNDYRPEAYVFRPMLDLMQRLVDTGFEVWIVTGSNPYFIATVLNRIEESLMYTPNRHYDFGITETPFRPGIDRIVGNGAELLDDGHFSIVYDDRYVKDGANGNRYVVNYEGKSIAIEKFIEIRAPDRQTYFCAGNSGGDVAMLGYVLKNNGTLGVAVNASGGLVPFVQQNSDTVIPFVMSVDSTHDRD